MTTQPAARIYSLAGDPADDRLFLESSDFSYDYVDHVGPDSAKKWLKLAVPSPPAGKFAGFESRSFHLDEPQTIGIMWTGVLRGSATSANPVHVTFGPNSGGLRHYLEFANNQVLLKSHPDRDLPGDLEHSMVLGTYAPDKIHTVIVWLNARERQVYVFFDQPTTTLVNRGDGLRELPEAYYGDRRGEGTIQLNTLLSGSGPTSYLISDVLMTTGPERRPRSAR